MTVSEILAVLLCKNNPIIKEMILYIYVDSIYKHIVKDGEMLSGVPSSKFLA